jgi:hypothetical protein
MSRRGFQILFAKMDVCFYLQSNGEVSYVQHSEPHIDGHDFCSLVYTSSCHFHPPTRWIRREGGPPQRDSSWCIGCDVDEWARGLPVCIGTPYLPMSAIMLRPNFLLDRKRMWHIVKGPSSRGGKDAQEGLTKYREPRPFGHRLKSETFSFERCIAINGIRYDSATLYCIPAYRRNSLTIMSAKRTALGKTSGRTKFVRQTVGH